MCFEVFIVCGVDKVGKGLEIGNVMCDVEGVGLCDRLIGIGDFCCYEFVEVGFDVVCDFM